MAELRAIKDMGVAIVMDDFGTGYSSLSYLWRFPFDKIKIDRSFIQAFDGSGRDAQTLVKTIIALGRELDMRVTVEGVETAEQAAFLDELHADQVQGFFFGRPARLRVIRTPASFRPVREFRGRSARDSSPRLDPGRLVILAVLHQFPGPAVAVLLFRIVLDLGLNLRYAHAGGIRDLAQIRQTFGDDLGRLHGRLAQFHILDDFALHALTLAEQPFPLRRSSITRSSISRREASDTCRINVPTWPVRSISAGRRRGAKSW